MKDWQQYTDWATVCRRASGRRRHNALRRLAMCLRWAEVAHLLLRFGHTWGTQRRVSTVLGVSEATISRDIAAIQHLDLGRRPVIDEHGMRRALARLKSEIAVLEAEIARNQEVA